MRNPDRIPPLAEEFAKIWKAKFPDWRFFQLMENFLGYVYEQAKFDPFFIEDDQVIKWLKKFAGDAGVEEED